MSSGGGAGVGGGAAGAASSVGAGTGGVTSSCFGAADGLTATAVGLGDGVAVDSGFDAPQPVREPPRSSNAEKTGRKDEGTMNVLRSSFLLDEIREADI